MHIGDVVQALMAMLGAPTGQLGGRRVALVGPQALTMVDYLRALRQAMGLPSQVATLSLPGWMVGLAARLGDWRRDALLDSAAWSMLRRGSVADAGPITRLLGRRPREPRNFIAPEHRAATLIRARVCWLNPLLRLSLAVVWLAAAFVSLAVYPMQQSHALLGRAGVPLAWQSVALWGASLLDLLLGLLTLGRFQGQRWLWLVQGLLILFYSGVIALRLPEFLLHPYGPLTKNLPILGLLTLLWFLEPPGQRRGA